MRSTFAVLAGLLANVANVAAAPAFTGQALQITNLRVDVIQGGQTNMFYDVYDPEPVANVSTRCSQSWQTGSRNSTSDALCGDNSVASSIEAWNGPQNFTLEIQHSFQDDSIGQAPWNQVVTYARATVNGTYIWCVGAADDQACTQRLGSTIKAPIYAAAAK